MPPRPDAPRLPYIAAAVADPARPAADSQRDADRKPAAMLEFAGVKPGMTVADLIPGSGYFTRLFSAAVGPTGKVYAVATAKPADAPADAPDRSSSRARDRRGSALRQCARWTWCTWKGLALSPPGGCRVDLAELP